MRVDDGFERFAFLKDGPVTSTFTTQIASSRQPPYTWLLGLALTIGYQWSGDGTPAPIIALGGDDCSEHTALTMDTGDRLVVTIDRSEMVDIICLTEPGMYLKSQATIDADGRRFNGWVASTCADRSGAASYAWTGTATAAGEAFRQIVEITAWRRARGLC